MKNRLIAVAVFIFMLGAFFALTQLGEAALAYTRNPKPPQVVDCNDIGAMICRECGYGGSVNCCNSSNCSVICDNILPTWDPKLGMCGK